MSIYETAHQFGYGQTVQELLPAENKGLIPNPLWKKRVGYGGWSTNQTKHKLKQTCLEAISVRASCFVEFLLANDNN